MPRLKSVSMNPHDNWIMRDDSMRMVTQCNRNNVQRRTGTTRHELMRQLNPKPAPYPESHLRRKEMLLKDLSGCVYCGADSTTEDHFVPLVVNGMPSGLIPTQLDTVPCCSWCNSSKGSRSWQSHMERLVQKSRHCPETHYVRVAALNSYSQWRKKVEQRWDVDANKHVVDRLNKMVNEFHSFMQREINTAVSNMHGDSGIQVHCRDSNLNWSHIVSQLHEHVDN